MNLRHLTHSEQVYIFTHLLRAVDYIHANDVTHRNLNPSNIFIDHERDIKIGNFQFAKTEGSSKGKASVVSISSNTINFSEIEEIMNTYAYHAPELFSVNHSPEADYYSLGVILLEMLLDDTD
jgi:serine/threonine protein kinase